MTIIPCTLEDISDIQKIAYRSWQESYVDIISQEQIEYMLNLMYSEEELRTHFKKNYHYFFIKNDAEKNVGFMGIEKDAEPDATKLHRLYLLKSEKGKGYGKAAIQFLKEWVKTAGNSKIILNVNKFNPAKEFYLKAGFLVYNEGVFDIGNNFVMDDFLMEFII